MSGDPGTLERFVTAQDPVYKRVLKELEAGRKQTHWMWFIFPQASGLGFSEMARRFAIGSREEAASYLRHPILGARLLECTDLVLKAKDRPIKQILGEPDDLKFRSSMTLFGMCAPGEQRFSKAIAMYFCGVPDFRTIELVKRPGWG